MTMRRLIGIALGLCLLLGPELGRARQEIRITSSTTVAFATLEQGRALLGGHDAFTGAMSRFDRAARMRVIGNPTEAEFLRFAAGCARPWSADEQRQITARFVEIAPLLRRWKLSLPPTVLLIKSTGDEDGHNAYTRGNAIIIPKDYLTESYPSWFNTMLIHEHFHVMSRHDPALRTRIFEGQGFARCNPIQPPPSIRDRLITNPDSPLLDHRIEVSSGTRTFSVVPVLYSLAPKFDPKYVRSYDSRMITRLLAIECLDGRWQPRLEQGEPVFVPRYDYFRLLGRASHPMVQPEELSAHHFQNLVENPMTADNLRATLERLARESEEYRKRPPAPVTSATQARMRKMDERSRLSEENRARRKAQEQAWLKTQAKSTTITLIQSLTDIDADTHATNDTNSDLKALEVMKRILAPDPPDKTRQSARKQ